MITANIGEGTADHLGSDKGSSFLEDKDELQRQFLNYCTGTALPVKSDSDVMFCLFAKLSGTYNQ